MKTLASLLLLAALSFSSAAQTPVALPGSPQLEAMIAECERQMALGTCTALVDKASYPPNAAVLIAGVGRVSLTSYLKIRNADKQMCVLARAYCTTSPTSDECKTSQALWGSLLPK